MFFLLLIVLLFSNQALSCNVGQVPRYAVTPERGGLFGDKLYLYAKAKWFSYKYNIPFWYKPFMYSDQLALEIWEKTHKAVFEEDFFKTIVTIPGRRHYLVFPQEGVLYHVRLGSFDHAWESYDKQIKKDEVVAKNINVAGIAKKTKIDAVKDPACLNAQYCVVPEEFYFNHFYYAVRDDHTFLSHLRTVITPTQKLDVIPWPKDKITVAMHIRMGGEFELLNKMYPQEISTRVPQESYYIEQLVRLAEMFDGKQMYVYIFTNHTNPSLLVNRIKRAVKKDNIEIVAREESSNSSNVLEDLFSMALCDCLIRPNSAFSQMAQLIGNHKIIIYPREGFWNGRELTIHKIGVIVCDALRQVALGF